MKKLVAVFAVGAFMFLSGSSMAAGADSLVQKAGSDVLVSQEIVNLIPGFDAKSPVYAASDVNGWLVRGKSFASASNLDKTAMVKEGDYYRAKGMAGKRFHPAQVAGETNFSSASNVRWAQVELLPGVDIARGVTPSWLDVSAGKSQPCIKK